MAVYSTPVTISSSAPVFPPNWYPDPWGIAPWRWWDGTQWTPIIYGPYGEAWPLPVVSPPFVPKGPGIKGGGVAAVARASARRHHRRGYRLRHRHPRPDRRQRSVVSLGQSARPLGRLRGRGRGGFTHERDGESGADYGLSWPRLKDVWLGLVGAVVGRILPLILLICLVVAGSGFGTPNGAAPDDPGGHSLGTPGGWS